MAYVVQVRADDGVGYTLAANDIASARQLLAREVRTTRHCKVTPASPLIAGAAQARAQFVEVGEVVTLGMWRHWIEDVE